MPQQSKQKKNFDFLKGRFAEFDNKVFSRHQLTKLLETFKEEKLIGVRSTLEDFINILTKEKDLKVSTLKGNPDLTRFLIGKVTDLELALSVAGNSYISHASALSVHGLASFKQKDIFITQEQSPKPIVPVVLKQEAVDQAFLSVQRPSNSIYEWKGLQIHLLKGKFSKNLGVVQQKNSNSSIFLTDQEKTLIDIAVRPSYAGGVEKVIEAYKNACGRISVQKLFEYLRRMKFIYPYHQAIGFYLQLTGYSHNDIKLFHTLPKLINFYLDYNINNKSLNEEWKIYIPAELYSK